MFEQEEIFINKAQYYRTGYKHLDGDPYVRFVYENEPEQYPAIMIGYNESSNSASSITYYKFIYLTLTLIK